MTGLARSFLFGGVLLVGGAIGIGSLRRQPAAAPVLPQPAKAQAVTAAVPSVVGPLATPFSPAALGLAELTVIAPALLEVSWAAPNSAETTNVVVPVSREAVSVRAEGQSIPVVATGFRRRAAYAPFKQRDLRIGNSMFLQLGNPLQDGQAVEVTVSGKPLWPGKGQLKARVDPGRWSPAIHVNQTGYVPGYPKKAMVGYFLGTLGEADFEQLLGSGTPRFGIRDATGNEVLSGNLVPRPDQGFPYPAYQKVLEADFSAVQTAGTYELIVPGLGVSSRFTIGEDVAGALARTYALGIYHQRCGTANALPYSRFTHGNCHLAPAGIPDTSPANENSNWTLETETSNCKEQPRHVAKAMTNVNESLYPFVRRGLVDVRGGHHDAGDYSKYTINSASFIHDLVIACDALPGVAALDNLGLPESGDGKGDLLQEAKWEADFLAKMQDDDGGFYFLVYPKGRRYENDVTPDRGDPQVVFPKTTSATAAAVAALAQCASSPEFKKQFPEATGPYLEKARKGWAFLTNAIAAHGKDGAYQKITHYGDDFMHDDELAWAAVELFLATGEVEFQQKVSEWFKPNDPELRKWGWVRLFDSQGNAIRSYALAIRTGRLPEQQLDPALHEIALQELQFAGEDQAKRSRDSAYGVSFPEETKRVQSAGWFFPLDAAFDMAIAGVAGGKDFQEAILGNISFEQGCNPVNVCYLTGLGAKRQFEVVSQYGQNDRRALPPTGLPLGSIQAGISWIDLYKNEPAQFSVPSDEGPQNPYPFYDRWTDAFNLSQEFVILNQARGLAVTAWLMAQTPLKDQPWKAAAGSISGAPDRPKAGQSYRLQLVAQGLNLSSATIIWEAGGMNPHRGPVFEWRPAKPGAAWVEAEAQLPDGRRVFGALSAAVSR